MRAISRAVSAIENRSREAEELVQPAVSIHWARLSHRDYRRAGTGKSTLVDRLTAHYRAEGKRSALSPSIRRVRSLAERFWATAFACRATAGDSGIFVRSMATRGYLGGLAQATGDAALLLDAAGKDRHSRNRGRGPGRNRNGALADCTVVVLMPGLGDEIQNLKAGVMEIGDIFVLNKCDREGRRASNSSLPRRCRSCRSEMAGVRRWSHGSHGRERELTTSRDRSKRFAPQRQSRTAGRGGKPLTGKNGCCDCCKRD